MKNFLLAPDLRTLLTENDVQGFQDFCAAIHPELVAECLEAVAPEEAGKLLALLAAPAQAEIFSRLEEDFQVRAATAIPDAQLALIVALMPHDDRADLINLLPEEKRESVYRTLAQTEREDIRRLASYEEGTTGASMTSDYIALTPELTAQQAIDKIRREAPQRETVYYCYVVDAARKLIGFVSLRDLIMAPSHKTIEHIMLPDVISARADEDREEAARKIAKFDFLAIPVVNEQGVLVGIVTHDDAMDIVEAEATEDILHMAGVGGDDGSPFQSLWASFRSRSPWLVLYLGLAVPAVFVVRHFSDVIDRYVALAVMMPIVAGMGGNVGNQAMAVAVRAMALDEWKNPGKIFVREVTLGLGNGLIVGSLTAGLAALLFGQPTLGLVMFCSMLVSLMLAGMFGVLFPTALRALKVDPALASSIFITTAADFCGFFVFLTLASTFLG